MMRSFAIFRVSLTLACFIPTFQPSASLHAQVGRGARAAQDDFRSRLVKVVNDLDTAREKMHVPGAALVIVKDDKIVAIKGMGMRDVEHQLPVTPQTLFAIGSSTKAFTAMTVMMSVDEGKLMLTDSPHKYLPYFKLHDPDADAKITISDLLCHRSGLARTDLAWYTGKLSSAEIIRVAGEAKPTAKFGEKFQYQNIMFLAAGEVVAAVQKRPWSDVVTRLLLEPLGMRDTTLSVHEMQRQDDYALGYDWNSETKATRLLPTRDLHAIAPAGAINSNAQDMAQWLRLMLNGGVYEGKRLISQSHFDQLITKHMDVGGPISYGYGWFLRDWHGHKVVEHGGNIDGFSAEVALMPDQKLGFVLLTNLNASPFPPTALNVVWDDLLGTPATAPIPTPNDPSALTPAGDPAREVGIYPLLPNLDLTVSLKAGNLVAQAPGQPELPLKNLGGRRYTVAIPEVQGIFMTFRASKDDPNTTELVYEQNGNTLIAKPKAAAAPFVSPLTVDELMAKTITAAGGEANLRKHKSLQTRFVVSMEGQGITGEGISLERAPNASAQQITLRAAGKKIATIHSYFDGTQGSEDSSFSVSTPQTDTQNADARIEADFYKELNWKTDFKTIAIKGMGKVGDEEVYIVEKTPEKGSPVVDRYSTKTFLLLQRETQTMAQSIGQKITRVETYSDYRPIDGVMIAFKRVQTVPIAEQETIVQVQDVKFDTHIPNSAFQPTRKK